MALEVRQASATHVVRSPGFHRSCLQWSFIRSTTSQCWKYPSNQIRSVPVLHRLQSNYSASSVDDFVLPQDILTRLNDHLRRHGETQILSSDLGMLVKSTFGDAFRRKKTQA